MALLIPPKSPTTQCRLWMPQVSQRLMYSSNLGPRKWKQYVLIMPAVNQIKRAIPGRQMKEQRAPMTTRPAIVALSMFFMSSPLPKLIDLTMKKQQKMISINIYAHANPMIFSHQHNTSMIKITFRKDGCSSYEKQLKVDTFTGK